MKAWVRLIGLSMLCINLSACLSDLWTGANVIYDRHHWYEKLTDLQLVTKTKQALYIDSRLKCKECSLETAVFKRDILIVGYVPTQSLRELVDERMRRVTGKRHYFNELALTNEVDSSDAILDSWITTKIRSEIVADSSIDPGQFKVITANRVVYLMGDVLPEQADKVVMFAREWSEVKRVVKLFQYYHLSTRPGALSSASPPAPSSLSPGFGRSQPSSLEQTPG